MYLDKFQTPFTVETISSRGNNFRFLLSKIAPRSFSSRYILLELNALKIVIFKLVEHSHHVFNLTCKHQ